MNDESSNELSEVCFDRLVDGELSAQEYRALLASCDADPALWRRCALAFLDAQALRGEIAGIRRAEAALPTAMPVLQIQRGSPRWLSLLLVAASFVIAFWGGLLVQQEFAPLAHQNEQVAQSHEPAEGQRAHEAFRPSESPLVQEQEPQLLGNIRLVVDGGSEDQQQPIEVPVYDLKQIGPDWLSSDHPALRESVIEALKRRGRIVESQVELLPLPLDEGRQIMLPVEQIQITPVSRRSY